MVIYKDFKRSEIQSSIIEAKEKMQPSIIEDAISWLHEALKIYTSRDGTSRDGIEICKLVKHRFEEKHGGYWGVCIGNANSFLTYYEDDYIWFQLDNNDFVLIFRSALTVGSSLKKDFTRSEVQASMIKNENKMSESTTEDAVTWLHEAWNTHTSGDGNSRDGVQICKFIKQRAEEKYGGEWGVIMGNANLSISHYYNNYIRFKLDNINCVTIFQSKPALKIYCRCLIQ
jgi:hypothetical protein